MQIPFRHFVCFGKIINCTAAELQKSHGFAGITREKGLESGPSVRKVSCQDTK